MDHSQPRDGGTLRLCGPGDLDHVDPAAAYDPRSRQIARLFSRQLFTYEAVPDLREWRAISPVPDIAVDIPSTYNAGLGASHLSYVVHLRRGVWWDTTPPREVTAHDVVRGFKRMCNPVVQSPALGYFTSTIRGMAEFRTDYAAAVPRTVPTGRDLADFQNTHDISGVFALDDETVVIELARPALDFVNMLAMTCASPAPVEYDEFVPDSAEFRRNVRSNGPYRLTGYVPGQELRLERNPAWRAESDPVRRQHVDRIGVAIRQEAPVQVARAIARGEADLPWGPAVAEPYDVRPTDPGNDLGYALDPYLVFNLRSANAAGAQRKVKVRQAIAYAIDKAAIADIYDELNAGNVTRVAGSIVPPGNDAHQSLDPYPTAGDRGDPEKARTLLAKAGYPDGFTVRAIHLDTPVDRAVARSYAADLEKAGITVRLLPLNHADYHRRLRGPAPDRTAWDIAAAAWSPDWFYRNGRVFLQPMFASGDLPGTGNHGGYRDGTVDRLIGRALDTVDPTRAVGVWQEVERRVLKTAAVVPILFQTPAIPRLRGPRVRNATPMPSLGHSFDLSTVWLDPPA